MGELAVRVEGVGKEYRLGVGAATGALLSERLGDAMRHPFGRRKPAHREGRQPVFQALTDVTFDVAQGETVGIIGRNGAGKSTLLKILSRITAPSTGRVELYGRTGALLEVGTGFHPELTGRENVYLNGAILGMRRAEITRKFDEIVAFADIDRFIDTPVKRYSSGMAVRLAFAVAAHLEPEILIVDEVLAVGDTMFQRKCLGKMSDVAREGRTVVFVSHDLTAVQVLCQTAIRLHRGRVEGIGPVTEQVAAYLAASSGLTDSVLDRPIDLGAGVQLTRLGFLDTPLTGGAPATFEIEVRSETDTRLDELAGLVNDALGRRIAVIDFRLAADGLQVGPDRPLRLEARLSSVPLVEGEYRIGLSLRCKEVTAVRLELVSAEVTGRLDRPFVPYRPEIRGVLDFETSVHVVPHD